MRERAFVGFAWEIAFATLAIVAALLSATVHTWSPQGHRLVALVATNRLSTVARQNVKWLLGDETLADVAVWADAYVEANTQTLSWHFVSIPADATHYDRDRDCPRQPGINAGDRGDRWRDCVVDRIAYNQERLADASLDRADRAIALKFLVHLIADVHQPFHAFGVERGGNDILVSAFGSPSCVYDDGTTHPCNLHSVWDTVLIAHRRLGDPQYLEELEREIRRPGSNIVTSGSPADWAMESHELAKSARLPQQGVADEVYYRAHVMTADERLMQGGLRLAAVLNRALAVPPPQ